MKGSILIFDSNFFIGILRNSRPEQLESFIEGLKASLDENGIVPIIPFRVFSEIDGFDHSLAKLVELAFGVREPVDTVNDDFYRKVLFANRSRPKKKRWFHPSEVTDIALLAVASAALKNQPPTGEAEVSIVSNDEGIQAAARIFFKGAVRVIEPATFLGQVMALTNDPELQRAAEGMSRELFSYFTNYRKATGRPAVSQINAFFSEMLNAILLARQDVAPTFDGKTLSHLERHVATKDPLPLPLQSFGPVLAVVARIVHLEGKAAVDSLSGELAVLVKELDRLAVELKDPTEYTRLYNYVVLYIINARVKSFTHAFKTKALEVARCQLSLAMDACKPWLASTATRRIFLSLAAMEAAFLLVTGLAGSEGADGIVSTIISWLSGLLVRGLLPPLFPAEEIVFLAVIDAFRADKDVLVDDTAREPFVLAERGVKCTAETFNGIKSLVEDFCDDLVSFGNHDLAIAVSSRMVLLLEPGSDEHERVEGKAYLARLVAGKVSPALRDDFGEKTSSPLDAGLVFENPTPVGEIHPAFGKRMKILSVSNVSSDLVSFKAWIYPLKSIFVVSILKSLVDDPDRVKEIKVRAGRLKVVPRPANDTRGARGTITIDPGATVSVYEYMENYFTLESLNDNGERQ